MTRERERKGGREEKGREGKKRREREGGREEERGRGGRGQSKHKKVKSSSGMMRDVLYY